MRIFDSCMYRVTLADVADDIASDMRFQNYLKKQHEQREREKAAAVKNNDAKENMNNDKKTGNC